MEGEKNGKMDSCPSAVFKEAVSPLSVLVEKPLLEAGSKVNLVGDEGTKQFLVLEQRAKIRPLWSPVGADRLWRRLKAAGDFQLFS